MKQYRFEVVITEGNDEYWEEINKGSTFLTPEQLLSNAIRQALFDNGIPLNEDVELDDVYIMEVKDV